MERYIWTLSPAGMGLCVLAAEVGRIIKQGHFVVGGAKNGSEGKKLKNIVGLKSII